MADRGRSLSSFSLVTIMIASAFLASPLTLPTHSSAAVSQSVCSGGPAAGFQGITENQTNVTSELSAVASGVSVTEITSPSSGYSASFVYYDTPVYSPATNKIVYYAFPEHGPDLVVMADVDGSDAQVVGQSYANPIITSDGRLVIFANPTTSMNSADVYAINLTQPGPCKTYRLTNYNFPQGPISGGGAYATVYYYSEYDPAASQDIIYVWQYGTVYRVYENGTSLPPVTIPNPYGSPWATFHHLKPNPTFPNIVAYLWDQVNSSIGTPETYVVNLNNPSVSYLAFNSTNQGHENWAPNGQQLGDADWPYWIAASVIGPNGSIIAYSKPVTYTYSLSMPLSSDFGIEKIGPNVVTGNSSAALEYAPQYCAWGQDSDMLACSSISGNRTGSQYGNKPIYVLYLNGTAKFVASTDSQLLSYWGEPALVFVNGSDQIIYRSDRDGSPQLYEITLGSQFSQPVTTSQTSTSSTAQIASSSAISASVTTSSNSASSSSTSTPASMTASASTAEVSLTSAEKQGTAIASYAIYAVLIVAACVVIVGSRRVRRHS